MTAEVPLLHFQANAAKGNKEFELNLLFIDSQTCVVNGSGTGVYRGGGGKP